MQSSVSTECAAGDGAAEMVPTPRKRTRQPTPSVSPQDDARNTSSGSGPCSPVPAASGAAARAAVVPDPPAVGQVPQAAVDCFMLPRQPTKRRLFGVAAAAAQPEPAAPVQQPAQPTAAEQQQTAAFLDRIEHEAHIRAVERFAEHWGFDVTAGQPLPHPRFAWQRA